MDATAIVMGLWAAMGALFVLLFNMRTAARERVSKVDGLEKRLTELDERIRWLERAAPQHSSVQVFALDPCKLNEKQQKAWEAEHQINPNAYLAKLSDGRLMVLSSRNGRVLDINLTDLK